MSGSCSAMTRSFTRLHFDLLSNRSGKVSGSSVFLPALQGASDHDFCRVL
jgi:hypothetical protein